MKYRGQSDKWRSLKEGEKGKSNNDCGRKVKIEVKK